MKGKSKALIIAPLVVLSCLLCMTIVVLSGCGNNNSGNNGSGVSTGTGSESSTTAGNGNKNKNSYQNMIIGWGFFGEELNSTPAGNEYEYEECVLDAQAFMVYVQASAQVKPWYANNGKTPKYTGQNLTLVSSGTNNPDQLAFLVNAIRNVPGVGQLYILMQTPVWPEITFVGDDGETYNLFAESKIRVYYSPEVGILTFQEYLDL
ncbi:MAG: hypothetical protein FWG24_03525 [Eggerthellaceae bacterium]|nr:hypothetical protein [Eggerthellaceae bacterium]